MLLYRCRFTGDEMLSSAFNPRPVVDDEGNVVEGLIEIDSQKVNKVSMSLFTAYTYNYSPFRYCYYRSTTAILRHCQTRK